MLHYKDFGIIQVKGQYIVFNKIKGFEDHHTHVKRKDIAFMLCRLASTGELPKSKYIAESLKRIM
jgi:hypothetical protein